MNNDRKLLELAAKAAGIKGEFGDKFNIGPDEVDCTDLFFIEDDSNCAVWNPLTDDGDALRLAVKLGMGVEHYVEDNIVETWIQPEAGTAHSICELTGDDPYAATRRAIVRAAAWQFR